MKISETLKNYLPESSIELLKELESATVEHMLERFEALEANPNLFNPDEIPDFEELDSIDWHLPKLV